MEQEQPKQEFSETNPDPNSNHDWYAQFDPNSAEYHGSKDTRVVPTNMEKKAPESMPTEYAPGMTQEQAVNQVDPTELDEQVIAMKAGYKFCADLKKKLTEVGKAIQTRAEVITKKQADQKEDEKKEELVDEKVKHLIGEVKAFIEEGTKNVHLNDMSEVLNAFWKAVDELGVNVAAVKKEFNVCFTATTRAVFKEQNNVMAKMKARKKEVLAQNKENN